MSNKKVLLIVILLILGISVIAILAIMTSNNKVIDVNASALPSNMTENPIQEIDVDIEFNIAMKDIEQADNIIDKSFLELFEYGDSSYLLNVITEYYSDAWRDELKNAIKDTTEIDKKANDIQNQIITQIPDTTGATYYSNIAKARIYREETLKSIDSVYKYSFDISKINDLKQAISFEE